MNYASKQPAELRLNTTNFQVPKLDSPGIELYTPEYAGNPNLCAQKGVFSLYRVSSYFNCDEDNKEVISFRCDNKIVKPFDEIIKEQINSDNNDPILYKILIPTPQNDELYNYLSNEGYDASLIFPGYEGAAKTIKEDIYWKNLKRKDEQKSK